MCENSFFAHPCLQYYFATSRERKLRLHDAEKQRCMRHDTIQVSISNYTHPPLRIRQTKTTCLGVDNPAASPFPNHREATPPRRQRGSKIDAIVLKITPTVLPASEDGQQAVARDTTVGIWRLTRTLPSCKRTGIAKHGDGIIDRLRVFGIEPRRGNALVSNLMFPLIPSCTVILSIGYCT